MRLGAPYLVGINDAGLLCGLSSHLKHHCRLAVMPHVSSIDAEIDMLKERIRRLRTRRNTHSPLFRLLPDILHQTFADLGEADDSGEDDPWHFIRRDSFACNRHWWALSTTCAHLRAFAIASPLLWARVDLTRSGEEVQMSLDRAGTAPLSLCCNETYHKTLSPDNFERLRALIWQPRCQIREIALSGRQQGVCELL
jgi:hypothetical protein